VFGGKNIGTTLQYFGRNAYGQIGEEMLLLKRFAGREIIGQWLADQQDERIFRFRQKLKEIGGVHADGLDLPSAVRKSNSDAAPASKRRLIKLYDD